MSKKSHFRTTQAVLCKTALFSTTMSVWKNLVGEKWSKITLEQHNTLQDKAALFLESAELKLPVISLHWYGYRFALSSGTGFLLRPPRAADWKDIPETAEVEMSVSTSFTDLEEMFRSVRRAKAVVSAVPDAFRPLVNKQWANVAAQLYASYFTDHCTMDVPSIICYLREIDTLHRRTVKYYEHELQEIAAYRIQYAQETKAQDFIVEASCVSDELLSASKMKRVPEFALMPIWAFPESTLRLLREQKSFDLHNPLVWQAGPVLDRKEFAARAKERNEPWLANLASPGELSYDRLQTEKRAYSILHSTIKDTRLTRFVVQQVAEYLFAGEKKQWLCVSSSVDLIPARNKEGKIIFWNREPLFLYGIGGQWQYIPLGSKDTTTPKPVDERVGTSFYLHFLSVDCNNCILWIDPSSGAWRVKEIGGIEFGDFRMESLKDHQESTRLEILKHFMMNRGRKIDFPYLPGGKVPSFLQQEGFFEVEENGNGLMLFKNDRTVTWFDFEFAFASGCATLALDRVRQFSFKIDYLLWNRDRDGPITFFSKLERFRDRLDYRFLLVGKRAMVCRLRVDPTSENKNVQCETKTADTVFAEDPREIMIGHGMQVYAACHEQLLQWTLSFEDMDAVD